MPDDEVFYPTLAFGFSGERLMQLWVGSLGGQDWRKVPTLDLPKTVKPQSIAGFVPIEDEDDA